MLFYSRREIKYPMYTNMEKGMRGISMSGEAHDTFCTRRPSAAELKFPFVGFL